MEISAGASASVAQSAAQQSQSVRMVDKAHDLQKAEGQAAVGLIEDNKHVAQGGHEPGKGGHIDVSA